MSASALVLGGTGLCGGYFVKYALAAPQLSKIFTVTRRPLKVVDSKLIGIEDSDTTKWASAIDSIDGNIDIVMTALSTTRSAGGGADGQYKIDHDLNLELIRAAKVKKCKTVVVITSMGANKDSRFFYPRMKGEIETDICNLGFEKVIILRPGLLIGDREETLKGLGVGTANAVGGWMHRHGLQNYFPYPINGEQVSQVGVHLALDPKNTQRVRIVENKEILEIAEQLNSSKHG